MKTQKKLRIFGIVLCEAFTVFTILYLLKTKEPDRIALACITLVLVLLPAIAERLFHCHISTPAYIFCLLYAIGSMLGHCWKLYYRIAWWDELLHACGGVTFAVLGIFLFNQFVEKSHNRVVMAAVFALCFSMAIAVAWEFVEFGADRILGMDMQNDTIVTGFSSYYLGDGLGMLGEISDITTVTVNGTPLPFDGYLDIGLFDTMYDMLTESIGALIAAVIYVLDRGRHPIITAQK